VTIAQKNINIREFSRNFYKNLKECRDKEQDIVVTSKGEIIFVVTFPKKKETKIGNVITLNNIDEKIKEVSKEVSGVCPNNLGFYGCGCPKEDKKSLCTLHQRY